MKKAKAKTPTTPPNFKKIVKWLEGKNPAMEYSYISPNSCLLFQFLTDMNYPVEAVIPFAWREKNKKGLHDIPHSVNFIAAGDGENHDAARSRWTYGEALKRAKQVFKDFPLSV